VNYSPYSEDDMSSVRQEITRVLWNTKVRYLVHKSPPLAPIDSRMNLDHIFPRPVPSRCILLLYSYLGLGL